MKNRQIATAAILVPIALAAILFSVTSIDVKKETIKQPKVKSIVINDSLIVKYKTSLVKKDSSFNDFKVKKTVFKKELYYICCKVEKQNVDKCVCISPKEDSLLLNYKPKNNEQSETFSNYWRNY